MELVLCVETAALEPALAAAASPEPSQILSRLRPWFAPREDVEEDPRFVQPIPYVMISTGPNLLAYERTSTGGEARLRGRTSFGFGGHVNVEDAVASQGGIDLQATLKKAAARELREELGDLNVVDRQPVCLIYDRSSSVSARHLGIVERWFVEPAQRLCSRDRALAKLETVSLPQAASLGDRLEGWSRLALAALQPEPDEALEARAA